jgi:hypothetical protein
MLLFLGKQTNLKATWDLNKNWMHSTKEWLTSTTVDAKLLLIN